MRPAFSRSRVFAFLLAGVLAGGGLTACGGDSEQDKQAALEQARAEGRKQEREKSRQKDIEQKTKDLEKEIQRLKKTTTAKKSSSKSSSGSGGSSGSTRNASSSGGGGGSTSCGSGITVNSVTSCEFAHIVRDTYYSSGSSSSISAYSPVTGMSYSMTCTTTGSTTCRGGNNAQVTFP